MKHLHAVFTNLLLTLALAWATGCGDRGAPTEGATIAGGKPTPIEESLTRWRAGDSAGAIQRFLEIDWKQSPVVFTPGSPLSLREKDLPKMSAADQERLMGDVLAQLKDLKQLATAVREKGTAAGAKDPELARRCFAKLDECGAALDQPEAMKILQLTAQAIRKMSVAAAAQPAR
jgi:hypothetical protein